MTAGTPALDEITEPRLVYWDLWDGNVMVDTTTHELTGMLDLERALWGDPLMESQFSPHVDSPALLAAYGPSTRRAPEHGGDAPCTRCTSIS